MVQPSLTIVIDVVLSLGLVAFCLPHSRVIVPLNPLWRYCP